MSTADGSLLLPDTVRATLRVVQRGHPALALRHLSKAPLHGGSVQPNHGDHWLTTPLEVAEAWWSADDQWTYRRGCGFAVITGVGLRHGGTAAVVLDVDGGWADADDLVTEAGDDAREWSARTLWVQRTPERGHLHGLVPAPHRLGGEQVPPTGRLTDGLEWRALGGYVALPGHLHPSGSRYEVTRGAEPLPVPESLLRVVEEHLGRRPERARATRTQTVGVEVASSTGAAYAVVLAALDVASDRGGQALAHCPGPTHRNGDRHPSLSVTRAPGCVLLHCFAGCTIADVAAALGLTLADLFDDAHASAVFTDQSMTIDEETRA